MNFELMRHDVGKEKMAVGKKIKMKERWKNFKVGKENVEVVL